MVKTITARVSEEEFERIKAVKENHDLTWETFQSAGADAIDRLEEIDGESVGDD